MAENKVDKFMLVTIAVVIVIGVWAVVNSMRGPQPATPPPPVNVALNNTNGQPAPTVPVAKAPTPTPDEGREDILRRILYPETAKETEDCVRFYVFALFQYASDNGDFPTTEEGLAALSSPPERHKSTWGMGANRDVYSPAGMKDMWGRSYHYERKDNPEEPFYICSLGQDGILSSDDLTQTAVIQTLAQEFKHSVKAVSSPTIENPTPVLEK